jgi:hypothetical protein
MVVGGQAESLHHTWLVGSAVYEADFQPAMCFLTCDPGRRPKDPVLPWACVLQSVVNSRRKAGRETDPGLEPVSQRVHILA